ncbi:hypothetical protein [Deinococcus sp.]|uniref:hypothetical protein n=1 Tax=Deinococcus sp. TaxID=47478 RepID=UPI003C7D9159
MQLELATELPLTDPQPHPLAGVALRVLAEWSGDDSVLVEHLNTKLLSVVHLSYAGRQELANHPTVEFTGTYEDFALWHEIVWLRGGVRPED